jgi:hypothetical protein
MSPSGFDQPFEIVVEAEAGAAKILGGENYLTSIVVQDLSDFSIVTAFTPANFSGSDEIRARPVSNQPRAGGVPPANTPVP